MPGGWERWPREGLTLESKKRLGVFTLLLCKRDAAKGRDGKPTSVWGVDLGRGSATTTVMGRDVVEAEQHALLWALPIVHGAAKATDKAYAARSQDV